MESGQKLRTAFKKKIYNEYTRVSSTQEKQEKKQNETILSTKQ